MNMNKLCFLLLLIAQTLFSQSIIKENVSWSLMEEDGVLFKYENTIFRVLVTDYLTEELDSLKKKYALENELEIKNDSDLKLPHFYVHYSDKLADDLYDNFFYYYVGIRGKIAEIAFASIDRFDKTTVNTAFFDYLTAGQFDTLPIEEDGKINFVGRAVPKNENWEWIQIDRLADKTTGEQMNWSVHSSLEKAKEANAMQLQKASIGFQNPPEGNQLKLVTDVEQEMLFEDMPTKVRKLVYVVTSQNNDNQKYITYVIAQKVRGKNIACVMSFYLWGEYSEDRLPPMLSNFLKVK